MPDNSWKDGDAAEAQAMSQLRESIQGFESFEQWCEDVNQTHPLSIKIAKTEYSRLGVKCMISTTVSTPETSQGIAPAQAEKVSKILRRLLHDAEQHLTDPAYELHGDIRIGEKYLDKVTKRKRREVHLSILIARKDEFTDTNKSIYHRIRNQELN
jgi:hypothetical protein